MLTASGTSTVRARSGRILRRLGFSIGAVALGSLALSSCSANTSPDASTTPRAHASTPSPAQSGTALDSTRLKVSCDELVPTSALASSASGMTAVQQPAAPHGTDAAVIAAYGGTVCAWKSDSGQTVTLAVGQFAESSLTSLKNSLVTSSNPVPTYQGEGYFRMDGATGTAEAFSDPYWVVGISKAFTEPGGAEPLVDAAIKTLAARG